MGFFHLPCCNFQPGSFGCPCFSPDQSWYEKHTTRNTRTDATVTQHLTTLQGYDLFCCSKGALDIFSSNTMMALAPVWRMLGHMGCLVKKSYEKHIFLYGSYICAHRQFWNDTCVYLQLRHGKQLQIGQARWRSRKQTTNLPTWHNLQNFYYTCSAIKSYRKSADSLRFQPDLQLSPFAPARWGDLWFRSSGMLVKLISKARKAFHLSKCHASSHKSTIMINHESSTVLYIVYIYIYIHRIL